MAESETVRLFQMLTKANLTDNKRFTQKQAFSGDDTMRFMMLTVFLYFLPVAATSSDIQLLEPEIVGRRATIRYNTRNYFPGTGQRILFQLARDQFFTQDVVYHEVVADPRVYQNLADGDYYVRAHIMDSGSEQISTWSNTIWFRIVADTVPRPTLLLQGTQPITEDVLRVVWTPIETPNMVSWHLQMSLNPDFPSTEGATINLFPAVNEFEAQLPLDDFNGSGQLFLRLRARFPLENSRWSNMLLVNYERPVEYIYSLPHIPQRDGWETWIQLSMPFEIIEHPQTPKIEVSFMRPSVLGDPQPTQLAISSLEPGGTLRVPLSEDIDGAPVMVRSTVPLSMGLHFVANHNGNVGIFQVTAYKDTGRVALSGMVERRTGDAANKSFSGLVVANQSDRSEVITLRFQVLDTLSNRIILEREDYVFVTRWSNEVFLLSDFLVGIDDSIHLNWSVNVFATTAGHGVDLLGATFNTIDGVVFPSYFQGVPY